MTKIAEQIQSEALQLAPADRAELVRSLLLSLDGPDDADAEPAWDAELERCMERIEAGADQGRPAEDVLAGIRAKYS